ncbi:hypothetical protein PMKS-003380 [Pichia membranifaciens]|uniref:RING-type domain-containing protein n=1 Tax=Pichia membranifaciens TaxID=4926 RepID=A0A1Q2YK06_9ASCO|nr:hypothetical protein PMKS-003380 [Pichia membranifaciens]
MELNGEGTTRYTLCFDLFLESDIFKSDTRISDIYLETLVQKNIAQPLATFRKSSWIDTVWEKKDIFYPKDKSEEARKISLSKWSEKLKSTRLKLKRQALAKADTIDYRFTAVEVTPIEPKYIQMSASQSHSQLLPKASSSSYITDKLCAELLGFGVVRLYKDSENHINLFKIDSSGMKHVPGDETTLAILSVPFYFSASDLLLGFFDEDDAKELSHIRLIKSSSPNRFMILLKFRLKEAVKPFLRKYQGRKFNSFEPETCSVVEIKEIVFRPKTKTEGEHTKVALPYLLEDPFTNNGNEFSETAVEGARIYTELATCPVCLDRLDSSVTGLFTIPCQHTFHSSCLSKWKDDTCPVCRYSNKMGKTTDNFSSLSLLENATSSNPDNNEECMVCGLTEHLWICLICGNVGCGRYDQQHAIKHWQETGHCFSMETNTQRVWDYAEDGYVHRLVQNEADGKIVELPLRDDSKKTSDEKVEKIGFEYSKMLIGQLESQREYYEKIISNLNKDLAFQKQTSLRFTDKVSWMEKQILDINAKMTAKNKQMQSYEKMEQQFTELKRELTDANALNEAFSSKLALIESENLELKSEKSELQEQVTDLMFFLESQEKFKDASDDVKEGQVVMVPKKSKAKSKKR